MSEAACANRDGAGRPAGVVYVANSGLIGGGNRVLMSMAAGIDRRQFSPRLIVPFEGPLTEWAKDRAIPVNVVPAGDHDGRTQMLRRAVHMTIATRGDETRIVHAMDPMCYRAAGWMGRLRRAKRVCHLGFPITSEELRWCLSTGPEVLVGCHNGQAADAEVAIRSWNRTCQVVSIPNAVDTALYASRAQPDPAHPLRFGAQHVVLIVGHLSEVKGYPTFLDAAARIARSLPDCAFVALGGETASPGYRAELERRVETLGLTSQVHFLGWRSDVAQVLSAADVMVLPSLEEGLPMSVLEAMACGCPVVATPVGGVPDAVVDGETGFLVPEKDEVALSRTVLRILEDPALRQALGESARRRIEEEFSLVRFIARVTTLYETLIEGGDPTAPRRSRASTARGG